MRIETTLNVRDDYCAKIQVAADSLGCSRSEVIIMLLRRVMDDDSFDIPRNQRVKYQERGLAFKKFHISFSEIDYEFFLNLRMFLKLSLSHILSLAVEKYLNEKMAIKTDKNSYPCYIITKNSMERSVSWQINWGIPENGP